MTIPVSEARKNNEVISLADNQVLRWIDELNGITDADQRAKQIKQEILELKSSDSASGYKKRVRQLYADLDSVQFKQDYMCLIIDKEKDYRRACEGFSINGMTYRRLLGTPGGIKNSTIVFVSERYVDEIRRRIDNGRDMSKELVPAKLEAYRALTCSASTPVSMPHGVLVVHDCMTEFREDTIQLDNDSGDEPNMRLEKDTLIQIDASDGFGLMLPSLSERWSAELGLDYMMSGCNTRASFEKGMVFTFDFIEFAEKVAGSYIVKDVWGHDIDIRNVELILTESMLKLWDSYESIESYIDNCENNRYTFCVTKTCPRQLENERRLNYQFIQSYKLSDEEIDELISPTVEEIRGALGLDWAKMILFLRGTGITEKSIGNVEDGLVKALMADRRVADDPYVQKSVYHLIKNRINEAKVGVLNVHGNYSIVCGDPYSLCQSIFGLPVSGLLKAGEIYNKYWADCGANELACYRAPMTSHNNIRKVRVADRDDVAHWFRYITTGTVFNSFDSCMCALNGMDFDGDLVMLTDNRVLVDKLEKTPSIMCAQHKAPKKIPNEDDMVRSNVSSFGNDIGKITNRITSMYELQSRYSPSDKEYAVLDYRIKCGQLIQQDAIDKAKGIISKPMPKVWYDRHTCNQIEDEEQRKFMRSIVADKKPYFMRYIYPDLMRTYNTYINNTERNSLREFQMTVDELMDLPASFLTERQLDFIYYYNASMPVGIGDCVMNKICRKIEDTFDGFVFRSSPKDFKYEIMKSDTEYDKQHKAAVNKLFIEYNNRVRNYEIFTKYERVDEEEAAVVFDGLLEEFIRECDEVCQTRRELCDILLDICYSKSSFVRLVWETCPEQIVANLLNKNGNFLSAPVMDDDGDIEYSGHRFSVVSVKIGEDSSEYCS